MTHTVVFRPTLGLWAVCPEGTDFAAAWEPAEAEANETAERLSMQTA